MKQNNSFRLQVGGSFILVIFVVLSLVVFAALSVLSAGANEKTSLRAGERITEYYQACNRAEETLSRVDSILLDVWEQSDRDSYLKQVSERLEEENNITAKWKGMELMLYYSAPVNDTQQLEITAEVCAFDSLSPELYTLIEWRTVSTVEWEEQGGVQLIGE